MPNLTLVISEELKKKMGEHSEIRWSEIARKAISERINDLEFMEKIARKSRLTQKDADEISAKIDREISKKLGSK